MPTVVVKRFLGGYTGTQLYSIRRHDNGFFQIYHDNPFEGIKQPYQFDEHPLQGLYADPETAEAELRRLELI